MRLKEVLFLIPTLCAYGFEKTPWLEFPYEFHFRSTFEESYYSSIDRAYPNRSQYQNSFNEELRFNLGVSTLSYFEAQIETEFFQTKATTLTLESVGAQLRWQILDDIQGDPFSVTIGGLLRFVPDHALKDPYVPYAGLINFEGSFCIGKEFDEAFDWTKRVYLDLSIGQAIQGAPYLEADLVFQLHRMHHLFGVFMESYFGFAHKKSINLNTFHGYGDIGHQSVDLGVEYSYLFDIWGVFSIQARYRPYAFAFPKNQASIELRYDFPFSIL